MLLSRLRSVRPAGNCRRAAVRVSMAAALLLSLAASIASQAQSVAFQGLITTVAGNGSPNCVINAPLAACNGGDGGPATNAELYFPAGVAVDKAGNLYIADTQDVVIRKVSAATGIITTVAGNGNAGYSGDGGPATSAALNAPYGVAIDGAGNLYIPDAFDYVIRKVSAATGIITTVAGNGTAGYSGDGGPATSAEIGNSFGVAVDGAGNFYFSDDLETATLSEARIRKVNVATGIITTVAGNGMIGHSGDSGPATSAELNFPTGVALDKSGNLFIVDVYANNVRRVDAVTGVITTVAGNGSVGYSGDGGPATSAELNNPNDVAVDGSENIYIADTSNNVIRRVDAATGVITTAAGDGSPNCVPGGTPADCFGGDGGPATSAELDSPFGVAVDGSGNIDIADSSSSRVRQVQIVATNFAWVNLGQTSPVYSVGFTFSASTQLGSFAVLTQGASGLDFKATAGSTCTATTYTAGESCSVNVTFNPLYPGTRLGAVQLVGSGGQMVANSPLAGVGLGPMITFGIPATETTSGLPGASPSFLNQVGASSTFGQAEGIVVDPTHNIYVADRGAGKIYKATAASGYKTITGVAAANQPAAIALDGAGDLIWTDSGSGRILEAPAINGVIPASPTLITLASGLSSVTGLALDGQGDVYFSDADGLYELVAVNGSVPAAATPSLIENSSIPSYIAIDSGGDLFLIGPHSCVDEIAAIRGPILSSPTLQQLFCGAGDGPIGNPSGLAVDAAGDVWLSDLDFGLTEIRAISGTISASSEILNFSSQSGLGLGLDQDGTVFASSSQSGASSVYQYDFSDAPAFTWPGSTNVGATNPTTFTAFAADAGNAPLTVLTPASGTNPAIDSNWSWETGATSACPSVASGTASGIIPKDGLCLLTISFAPQSSGPLTGSLTFTDDSLYSVNSSGLGGTPATQSIKLTGTAISESVPTISWSPTTPITYGTALGSGDFNATVSAGAANISADGAFAYYIGSVGGTTATSSTILPVGTDAICVQWTPLSSFSSQYAQTSTCVNITVNAAMTSISWSPTTPITYGTALGSGDFNAMVSAGSANISADGTFAYSVGSVGGTTATASTILPVGTDAICVQWTPSAAYSTDYAQASTCVNITVNAAMTSISWTPSSPIVYPAPLSAAQLNASALAGSTNISADGTFVYYISTVGGTVANTGTVLPPGSDTLCVQWTPSSTYSADYSSTSVCEVVSVIKVQPTTTTLTSSANPVFSANAVTFTATVTPTTGANTPTMTVTFLDGTTPIGTGTLSASTSPSAVAMLTISSLAIGSHSITASYPGDTNNQASASPPVVEVVEDFGFAVAANSKTATTVEPGSAAAYTFTVSPASPATTFPAAIALSASGLPTGATYSFSPSGIAAGLGSTTVTLTITAPNTSLANGQSPSPHSPAPKWPPLALALLLLPLAGKLRRAGRKWSRLLPVLLLLVTGLAALAGLSGCGGVASGYFGHAQATSTITVTGNSGSLSHSASVSLTVE